MASHNYHKRRTKERKARQAKELRLKQMRHWLINNAPSRHKWRMSPEQIQLSFKSAKSDRRF